MEKPRLFYGNRGILCPYYFLLWINEMCLAGSGFFLGLEHVVLSVIPAGSLAWLSKWCPICHLLNLMGDWVFELPLFPHVSTCSSLAHDWIKKSTSSCNSIAWFTPCIPTDRPFPFTGKATAPLGYLLLLLISPLH